MMALIQLIGTAWTVWKIATKRVGPVGGFLVTAAVVGGLVCLKPWLTENAPVLAGLVGDP